MREEQLKICLLFAFFLLLFSYGSARLPFLGPDEPRYSQIAREMRESGDYIVPHLGDFAWFEKPVLLYWFIAGFYSLFGVNEFAARFPSALAALLSVFTIYLTIRRAIGSAHATVCAIVLATCGFFLGFSHAATFDILLTFTITASLCLFILYEIEPLNTKYLYGAYLFLGLGILAKGFVAPILVGLTLGTYMLSSRKWNVSVFRPVIGILIVSLVAALWFVPVSIIYGSRFWQEFVYEHHIVRYTSSYYHRAGSVFYYIPILLLGTYPWTVAPFLAKPDTSAPERKILYRIAGCWFLTALIFFSFSQSKLPGYILPAVPAFSIFAGLSLVDYFQTGKSKLRFVLLFGLLNLAMAIALLWGATKFPLAADLVKIFAIVVLIISGISIILLYAGKISMSLATYVSVLIFALYLTVHLLPNRMNWEESKSLSYAVLPYLTDERKIALYNVYDFSPLFYTNARMELTPEGYPYNIFNDKQLYRYLKQKNEAFVMVGNEELSWMNKVNFWRIVRVIPGKQNSIVQLNLRRSY